MAKEEKKLKEDKKEKKAKKHYFKDLKAELKKVIWPTPKQVVNNTVAVITIVLITAIIVLVLDFAFESLNKYGINNLKKVVGTTENVVNNTTNTAQENSTNENTQTEVNNTTTDTNTAE